MELVDLVVGGGVGGHEVGVLELDQGVLGAVGHHLLRGGHADEADLGEAGQEVEVAVLAAGDVARVDAGDVTVEVLGDVLEEVLGPLGAVEDHLGVPAGVLDGLDDRHGVLAVTVNELVGSALDLEDDDCLVHEAPLSESKKTSGGCVLRR